LWKRKAIAQYQCAGIPIIFGKLILPIYGKEPTNVAPRSNGAKE
jgi:hypothetical protein